MWVGALRVGVAPQANKFTDVRGYTEGQASTNLVCSEPSPVFVEQTLKACCGSHRLPAAV